MVLILLLTGFLTDIHPANNHRQLFMLWCLSPRKQSRIWPQHRVYFSQNVTEKNLRDIYQGHFLYWECKQKVYFCNWNVDMYIIWSKYFFSYLLSRHGIFCFYVVWLFCGYFYVIVCVCLSLQPTDCCLWLLKFKVLNALNCQGYDVFFMV